MKQHFVSSANNIAIYLPWTVQIGVQWDNLSYVREHVVVAAALLRCSIHPINNPAPLTFCLSLSPSCSLLHPSLPRRPLRGRFYSVWITCPSWRWACWWGENLFPPVEPWFKALRSTWFWVIVSPVVMNQGRGRQHTAYWQKQGVGVLHYATPGQLHWAKKHFLGGFTFHAQK